MNNNIIILHSDCSPDSASADNYDTLVQLQEISAILTAEGYKVTPVAFSDSLDNIAAIFKEINPKCIFNLVETVKNTDRLQYTAAAFIEYLGYQYTGCPAWSLAALSSKTATKKILLSAKLPTPDFIKNKNCVSISDNTATPWIIKPDTEHASFGIDSNSIIETASNEQIINLLANKNAASTYQWFAERFISGREFNVSILDNGFGLPNVLTPVEMTLSKKGEPQQHIGNKIIDYSAKWIADSENYNLFERKFVFDSHDNKLLSNIINICQSCWTLFGLKGAARIDLRIDNNNNPWIIDINPNPCLASDGGLIAAAQTLNGLSQKDLILKLINTI